MHKDGNGEKYMVEYEDGDPMRVRWQDILVCNLLPSGTQVLAEHNDGEFLTATITGILDRPDRPYHVQFPEESIFKRYILLANVGTSPHVGYDRRTLTSLSVIEESGKLCVTSELIHEQKKQVY